MADLSYIDRDLAGGSAFGAHDASVKIGGPPADLQAEAAYFVDRCKKSIEANRTRLAAADEAHKAAASARLEAAEAELIAAQAVLDSIQGA